ncbi:Hsp33 family molecular chaperone HslO [Pseudomaricurvus alkylphenolicus]|uniref:Hsp33 family molecular chaperone HslO n=1 Tax=Pseudomaricurvus alkylphenolicus TaxID=1306991 RepID=UPI001423C9EB|nr:Hsp33 family molecular chaperone HslO [Pseudomaricurvus alkylphenolicus]NIB39598.1 Hsp33 family molecular chaperone HslO [Pseudomaricurvus alkylphenolicus]
MSSSDLMHRFLFDHTDIRGEVVTLKDTYRQVLANNPGLPPLVQALLGEFVAAVSLLSSTLKFDGILTLQARGDGPLSLIMAECSHHKAVRAVVQTAEGADFSGLESANLQQLLGTGMLAIIIDPDKGERYQGIVPMDSPHLSGCLEHYFAQSEQLATRFWLASDDQASSGLMLQALPRQISASAEENQDHWETATQLADTVKNEELLQLDHADLLYRLFNEEEVRMFDPVGVRFECSCSRERSANALVSLGRKEVEALLSEQDMISINCQFCNQVYAFGSTDLEEIFGDRESPIH